MDGVYDQHGRLDHQHTDFLVSNDYVLHVVRTYPTELLSGVSINPRIESGAALVKVLPNSQRFDPANHNYKAFYRALAQHKIPLLSHIDICRAPAGALQISHSSVIWGMNLV